MVAHEIHVYRDTAGEWRWTKRPLNGGKTVADSSEGYTRKADAIEAAERERNAEGGDVVTVEAEDQ